MISSRWASLVLVAALGLGCSQRDPDARHSQATTRPLETAPEAGDRGGSGAGATGSQIIVAGSGRTGRAAAGAAAEEPSHGGGRSASDAELAAQRARCDKLVEHLVDLTRGQLPTGAARDKLEAQNDALRQMCMSMGIHAGEYSDCVMRARDLDAVLACNPVGDRAAGAFAAARDLVGRKDLLDKAEKMIGDQGGEASGPEGAASPAGGGDRDESGDLSKEHFLRQGAPKR